VRTTSPPPIKRAAALPGRAPLIGGGKASMLGGGQSAAPKLAASTSALAQKLPLPKKLLAAPSRAAVAAPLRAIAVPPRAMRAPSEAREEIYVEPDNRENEKCAPAPVCAVCARAAGPSRASGLHATAPPGRLCKWSLLTAHCGEPASVCGTRDPLCADP